MTDVIEARTEFGFDFDSTLILEESLELLAALALEDNPEAEKILAEIEAITCLGMTGQLAFDESLEQRLRLFSATASHVQQVAAMIADQHLSPTALMNTEWFTEEASGLSVISGGFTEMIVPAVAKLGLAGDRVYANEFTYDDRGNITGFNRETLAAHPNGKSLQVGAMAVKGRFIMVGDGSTDLAVRTNGLADEFWTVTEARSACREEVIAEADRVFADFNELVQAAKEEMSLAA